MSGKNGGNTRETAEICWQKAGFKNSAFEGLEQMLQPLCEYHESRRVKIVGCGILRCETMSLPNDMWYLVFFYL